MQQRMKTHRLTEEQIAAILDTALVGSIATVNADGSPYVVPIHFVYEDGKIFFHGLPKGQKVENIKSEPKVCLTVYEMDSFLLDASGNPCDTNTKYQSVVVNGTASVIEEESRKRQALELVVKKYTPQLAEKELPANMVKGTAVIEIAVTEITGKYYG